MIQKRNAVHEAARDVLRNATKDDWEIALYNSGSIASAVVNVLDMNGAGGHADHLTSKDVDSLVREFVPKDFYEEEL